MRGTSLPLKRSQSIIDRTTHLVLITLMAACCLATMLMGSNHLRRTESARVSPGVFPHWESDHYTKTHRMEDVRSKLGLTSDDFALITIATACDYESFWKEQALVMKAAASLMSAGYSPLGPVRVFVQGYGNSSSPYRYALQVMAQHVGLPSGVVQHVGVYEDMNGLLWASDAVVYTSGTEEHGFPPILVRSLTFERPLIVPDIAPINKHVRNPPIEIVC
ncbi:hypothetical protein MPTK1_5g19830 [Marchantia polymorpha subsp. ruderalis]|uniref:Glycosyl transferase family 1 domain-containing protein n=2 Tax=Marchantia polymorpha TaxID=3197 RepID=A0AAF6BK74_MARPO|nr:hypothetical protein MARPO_0134s0051 [Marchantia polymorpha]BBN12408.1 hypothetical protein Mp_5g19830 [Marchantia polymorpha subsp. ruderalis]|eukprot:PTQ29843.1 hypothetical protein MARPO_0134s0051 [Marchantia polymorpha]